MFAAFEPAIRFGKALRGIFDSAPEVL